MALPVVVPVAKALAPPAAAKAGAVLRGLIRNGPTLLRMVDQFRAPPSLGPQVADTPRRDRLRDLVADAIAGAQLGVASLPNPMQPQGPGGEWLRFALANLAPFPAAGTLARLAGQLWGELNGPPRGVPSPYPPESLLDGIDISGTYSTDGPTIVTRSAATVKRRLPLLSTGECVDGSDFNYPPSTFEVFIAQPLGVQKGNPGQCGGFGSITYAYLSQSGVIGAFFGSIDSQQGQTEVSVAIALSAAGTDSRPASELTGSTSTPWDPPRDLSDTIAPLGPDPWFSGLPSAVVPIPAAVPVVAAAIAQAEAAGVNPLPPAGAVTVPSNPPADWFAGLGGSGVPAVPGSTPGTLPGQVPTVQPLPAFVPRPVPGPSPAETQPETQPQVTPTTRPTTTPTTPATTPGAVPVPGPAGRPLTDAGTVPAPVQLPIPTTDPNFHFPVPGAPPVTGVQVRPDLKNIAKEVGRLEQKAARMLENQSDAEGKPFDLSELLRLLRLIWELLSGQREGGDYLAFGTCEVDAEGQLLQDQPEIEVPYAGADNPMDAVSAKVDAIAQLLQVHRELRRPICRPPKAQGQPVTVVFEDLGNG